MSQSALFDQVLALVCNVFDCYTAALILPDPGAEGGRVVAAFSLGFDVALDGPLPAGHGLAGWVMREKKPLLVGNLDQKRGLPGYYKKGQGGDIRAFLGVPLPDEGGALCVDTKKAYGFTDKDQKILAEFAQLLASLRKGLGGLEESRDELRVGPCLRRLTLLPRLHPKWKPYLAELLRLCAEATGFETCFLAVRDGQTRTYSVEGTTTALGAKHHDPPNRFPSGGGMIGWVFKHGAQALAQDGPTPSVRLFGVQAGQTVFESVICQPVQFSRRTRAVLVLASLQPVPAGETIKDFARTVADQLALFLENLHLKASLAART